MPSPKDSDILVWLFRDLERVNPHPRSPDFLPVSHSDTEETRYVGVIAHTAQQACMHVRIPTRNEMKIETESKAPSIHACLALAPTWTCLLQRRAEKCNVYRKGGREPSVSQYLLLFLHFR